MMKTNFNAPHRFFTARIFLLFFVLSACSPRTLPRETKEGEQPPTPPEISLHTAALQGNVQAVRQHIQAGSPLDEKDAYGSTPLIIATTFGKVAVARALIGAGADLSIPNNEGSTPLHLAAFFGHAEIAGALLDKGAPRHIRNEDGATAFDLVAAPFEEDQEVYDKIGQALGPLGLTLDYELIAASRPKIRKMLRLQPRELEGVDFTPLPGNGWETSTPQREGLEPGLVAELYFDAAGMEKLYSLLLLKNGRLIAEGYFNGGTVERKYNLQSVTKSYTSALAGIAHEQGHLPNMDQKMLDFFPDLAAQVDDPRKKQITIRNMLQMRSGYPWEESSAELWEDILTGDYLPLIQGIPLVCDPGAEFHYSNLTSHWLGVIVARACDKSLKSYGEEYLFRPLGVEVGDWLRYEDGYYAGMGTIHFTTRDMARFGQLYLDEGQYEGKPIIPADWVKESLQAYSTDVNSGGIESGKIGRYFRHIGYGYQWWSARVGEHQFDYAAGHGGQLIILLKELDMAIITTADPFFMQHDEEAWRYERAVYNLVGKFLLSLPEE